MAITAAGVAAFAAVAGTVLQGAGIISGGKASDKAAKRQAMVTRIQRQEEIRRFKRDAEFIEGEAVSRAYASGLIASSGSTAQFINELKGEHAHQINYMEFSSRMEQRAIKAGGAGLNEGLAGASTLLSGITAGIGAYSQAKKPSSALGTGGAE